MRPTIKLYGIERCHKTQFYKNFLNKKGLDFAFLDVEENNIHAEALCQLYENRKLNFPTITIGSKKLRNPTHNELEKWLKQLKLD